MTDNPLLAFLDESDETLQAVALAFIALEAQPGDVQTLNAIFRGIHSVRGNAPFFGLLSVQRLAHSMQDLLALLRERRVRAGPTEIANLLAGLALLKSMLQNVRQGRPELDASAEPELGAVLARLKRSAHAGYSDEAGPWQGVWAQLDHLATLGPRGELTGSIDALRSTLLSLAPAAEVLLAPARAGILAPPRLEGAAVEATNPTLALDELGRLLEPMFDGVLPAPAAERVRPLLELVLGSVSEEAHAIAARALGEHDSLVAAVGFVPLLRETLLDRVIEVQSALSASPPRRAPDAAPTRCAPPTGAPAGSGHESDDRRTLRVEDGKILEGFLVRVGKERLVLPLRAISESFRPTPDQLHTIAEHGECVSRRGRIFPLVRFNRVLALGAADRCPSEAIVVSIEVAGGHPAGLLVDQVLGVQHVVLREIAGIDTEGQVFAGGAVLGDGHVAMVVDVEKLGALAAAQMTRA